MDYSFSLAAWVLIWHFDSLLLSPKLQAGCTSSVKGEKFSVSSHNCTLTWESGGSYNLGLVICSFSGQRKQYRLYRLQRGPKALVFLWAAGEGGSTAHLQHTGTLMTWRIMREQNLVHFQIILPKCPCWALLFMVWKLADSHCLEIGIKA